MADLIHIPEPCHEDWDNMRPEDNGRHCLQCCKIVVDFTGWEVEAIASYLKNTKGNTCGRFTADQVQAPTQPQPEELARYVIRASMPFYRKLAAMIVLFFGLTAASCDAQKTTGEPKIVSPQFTIDTLSAHRPPVAVMGAAPVPVTYVADTTKHLRPLMGKPARPQHEIKGRVAAPKPAHKPKKVPITEKPPVYMQGDVQIVEPLSPPQQETQRKP